ncbi:MAG TPA: serine/threonine-protein kinase, partial [Pyrinomonadaceae bacterium]|nr:serine/threonine-protein kinase [Pyrinomonadaceae bacterium]
YLIEGEVGRGGMGAVYKAVRSDEHFEKRVAIKLIKRGFDTDDIIRRFRHERQILAALDHPNITRLLDGGATDDGLPYLVMDFVEGLPLVKYCQEKRLSVTDRLKLFLNVCSAVTYAHRNLVIHRDIKPSNIIVTREGVPKLLDFGIAKLTAPDSSETLGRSATQLMTPEYASPEQVLGLPVSTAADIYSLGVVLYELLTGRRPFKVKGRNPIELTRIITDSTPAKPSLVVTEGRRVSGERSLISSQLRGDLDNIILMAIRKEAERRYSSVEQFAADIQRHLKGMPVAARQDTLGYRTSKFIQRHTTAVAAGAGLVLALAGGLAATRRQARIARSQRDKAERVNQFLQKMLASADPRAEGKDIKVTDVLRLAGESLGSDFVGQPDVSADLDNTLGLTYLSLGQFESAELHLRRALDTRLAIFPRRSPEVANSMSNYGKLLVEKGDLDEAESLFRHARHTFRGERRSYDRDLQLARVTENLAYLAGLNARYEESIELYEEVLNILRYAIGENDPEVARIMGKLGNVLTVMDNREQAEPLQRRAVEILSAIHEPGHPDVASATFNLVGAIYAKKPDEAERLARQSLDTCRRILGEEHVDTVWALYNLAYVLINRERYSEAERYVREALERRDANFPDKHPVIGSCLLLLGRTLMAQGHLREADSAFQECLALRQSTMPAGHWLIATTMTFIGECLVYLGDRQRGIEIIGENCEHLVQKLGRAHEQTRLACDRLERVGRWRRERGN